MEGSNSRRLKDRFSFVLESLRLLVFGFLLFSCNQKLPKEVSKTLCDQYSKEALEYYAEIGFGSEFGSALFDNYNSRWFQDVKIKVIGHSPYPSDSMTILRVIKKLNEIIDPIQISLTEGEDYNIKFQHVAVFDVDSVFGTDNSEFQILPAQFSVKQHYGKIESAHIILLNEANKQIRNRLIWEELIQVFGLMQDRPSYPNSIFYDCKEKTCRGVNEPAPIDYEIIEILYNSNLPTDISKKSYLATIKNCTS